MKRVQIIDDREFTLEPLNECVIEVSYQEQQGWFGVNLDDSTADEFPFAWTVDAEVKTDDGVGGDQLAASVEQALEEVAARLREAQEIRDSEQARDPRNQLGALLQNLPSEGKGGWRRLRGKGADLAKRSTKAFQQKASQAGGSIKEGTGTFLEKAGQAGGNIKDGTGSLLEKASEKAGQSKEKLQGGVAKANLSERRKSLAGMFSFSKQCEEEGHIFDEIKLISTKGTLSRMCRRCHNIIKVDLDGDGINEVAITDTRPLEYEPVEDESSNGVPAQQDNSARVQIGARRQTPNGKNSR